MAQLSSKIMARISEGLKKFQPILESSRVRDINESDTVVLMTGILSDVLGFDKYSDITTELAIRGSYCDLALKIDGKIVLLIEAKAIGIELREQHVKQAVDYAANKGLEWVVLSNGVNWKVFKIIFSKPIQNILVCNLDLLQLKPKSQDDIEQLAYLSKEGIAKSSLEEYYVQKQATNKYLVGNILNSESVLNTIRKELKLIYPDIKVSIDDIRNTLLHETIKRDILEGEDADEARKKIARANRKKEKLTLQKNGPSVNETETSQVTENSGVVESVQLTDENTSPN